MSVAVGIALAAVPWLLLNRWLCNQADAARPLAPQVSEVDSAADIDSPTPFTFTEFRQAFKAGETERIAALEKLDETQAEYLFTKFQERNGNDAPSEEEKFLIDRIAELDPPAALALADKLSDRDAHSFSYNIIQRWAVDDADACREWLNGSGKWDDNMARTYYAMRANFPPTEQELNEIWQSLFAATKINIWSHKSQSDIDALYERAPGSSKKLIAPTAPILNDARRTGRWKKMLERILTVPAVDSLPLAPFLQGWMSADLPAALQWIETVDGRSDRTTQEMIFGAINWGISADAFHANLDWPALFNWTLRVMPHRGWNSFDEWVKQDLDSASEWLLQQEDLPPQAVTNCAIAIGERDPIRGLAMATAIEPEGSGVYRICQTWHWREPWATETWIRENLEEPETKINEWYRK